MQTNEVKSVTAACSARQDVERSDTKPQDVQPDVPPCPTGWEPLRWKKFNENLTRAHELTGVMVISEGGWETVAVILMDEVDRLRALVAPQG